MKALIFDSGLGGLTVYREITALRPDLNILYLADNAAFPYGNLEPDALITRVSDVITHYTSLHQPDIIVIACNTASTLVLPTLRKNQSLPVVGTVPAIKPACETSQTKRVTILGTRGTISREYTKDLIRKYGQGCKVTLIGSPHLASCAEEYLHTGTANLKQIHHEILPCFVEDEEARTDTIVLACTHYPFLTDIFKNLSPWPVTWIDPAPAIARRVNELVPTLNTNKAPSQICFTKTTSLTAALQQRLKSMGLTLNQTPHIPLNTQIQEIKRISAL